MWLNFKMKCFKLQVVQFSSILLVVVNLNLNCAKDFNDIDCEIKKRISGSSLKLSSAAIDQAAKHLKNDAHKKNSFQLFHCRCRYEVGPILKDIKNLSAGFKFAVAYLS